MKKKFLAVTGGILLSVITTIPAFAGSWQSNETGWWWLNDDGSYPINAWEWLDGNNDGIAECYYFDGNGYMLANTTTPDGYTVNADGAWVQDGSVQTKNVSTPAETAPATQAASDMPNIEGTYRGMNDGHFINAVFTKDGDSYWAEVDNFLKDSIPPYVGNGVFENAWTRFKFMENSNMIFEDLTTGEVVAFVKIDNED